MVYEEFAERGGRVTLLKLSIFFKKNGNNKEWCGGKENTSKENYDSTK